jgi:predicted dinucleotide-binding enzyme
MHIGILGSGRMGAKLGTIFARAGHQVVFSYSRNEAKLRSLARKAGADARAGTPREAAECDAVLLAVNWPRVDDALRQAHDLAGKVLLTCALPMNEDDTELVIGRASSGAEQLVKKTRGAHVVSAFGTVPSEALFGVFRRRTHSPRPSLVYCGDDAAAKIVARGLIHDAGFDPVDVGPLRIARYIEPCALLVAQVAYEGGRPPDVAYRFERFPEEE